MTRVEVAGGGGHYARAVQRARVLLVADEYYASLAAVRGLHAAGYEPWVGSTTEDGYTQRSRAAAGVLRLPDPGDPSRFVSAVADAAASLRVACVLPGTEDSLVALSGRESEFGDVPLGGPAPDVLARATDKAVLAGLAAEVGIATPPTVELDPASPDDAVEFAFPVVVKPARTVVSRDGTTEMPRVGVVASPAELRRHVDPYPDVRWLAQPFLAGRLIAVSGVARSGESICTVHQQAHRIFPKDCGVSAFAETVPRDPELDARLRELLRLVGLTGIWQTQLLADLDGGLQLIDLNPRMYGSLALAVAAGVNLPALWADVVLGRTPRVGDYRVGVRFRAEMRELGVLSVAMRERDAATVARLLVPRRRTTHAVLSLRDPRPALLLGRRILSHSPRP